MEGQAKPLQTWWQKYQKLLIIAVAVLLALLLAFALAVHWLGWDWTGFTSVTGPMLRPNEQYRPAKTLWDVLQLLFVPIILAIGGFVLNQIQKSREDKTTERRAQIERENTLDNQREVALQGFIDKISELLLKEHLSELKPEYEEVQKIARVRTLTVLPRLDGKRKGSVLQFLYEAGLINKDRPIVDLRKADLSHANLDGAQLQGVNLRGAHLRGATFRQILVTNVDLSELVTRVGLSKAYLREPYLHGEKNIELLHNAYYALLRSRGYQGEVHTRYIGYPTDLRDSDLREADLTGADLSGAILNGADLSSAIYTEEQLANAKSCLNIIKSR